MALTGGPTVTLRFKGDADDLHRTVAGIRTAIGGLATVGVGLGASVGVLGALGAAASAAVVAVAGLPAAFAGIGIAVAAQDAEVRAKFTGMKDHVMAEMRVMTESIRVQLLGVADQLTAAFDRMAPSLTRIFEMSAPHIKTLTDGLISLVENALPGFETAIRNSTPLVQTFSQGLGTLGTGIGNFFAELTKGTPGAVEGMNALFALTKDLLTYLGQLAANLANVLGPAFAELEPSIMQIVRALGDGLLRIAQSLAPYIGELGRNIADFLTAALDALLPIVEAIVPLLAEFGNVLLESVTPIVRELGPVLAVVAKELADGLRPVIPVVAQAFRDMAPTIKEIAEQAGPLLAEVIRTLAPLFLELVKGALELTNALLPVIPPLLEMANNAMPLVAGVINDVVIPAVRFLVTEFKGLIDYGVKLVDSWGEMSARWRTYWDEIKAAFADADAKIRAGIDAWVGLGETARKHWDALVQAIRQKLDEAKAIVNAFPEQVHQALAGMATRLGETARQAWQGFLDGTKALVGQIVEFVKTIPGQVVDAMTSAVSGTAKRMYDSGASMIDSFNKGIESKVADARAAGTVAVDAASNPFPQSPAKEGPLSGSGWTYFRGQSMIQGFIDGIGSMWTKVRDTVMSGMGSVSSQLNGALSQIQSLIGSAGINTAAIMDLARSAQVGIGPGGAFSASAKGIELKVAPGADNALSSMLMNLVRTGQLQLQRAGL